jgi:polyhydroxyalkanoic acid synthase PhaR subunit
MTKTQEASPESDVFAVWRELYDANEKAWTTALEQTMSTSEFGESSGRLLEAMLAAQKSVRENMRAYLETMNVPTREDIARLGELVVGLEEKSDQILDRLDVLEADVQGRSGDSARLDQIAKGLEAIERAVRGRAAEVAKIDRIAKRIDVIERAVRGRAAEVAKIDRIAKRIDGIERALRSRTTAAGKPAAGTSRTAAARASAPRATTATKPTTAKPTSRAGKAATPATGPVA